MDSFHPKDMTFFFCPKAYSDTGSYHQIKTHLVPDSISIADPTMSGCSSPDLFCESPIYMSSAPPHPFCKTLNSLHFNSDLVKFNFSPAEPCLSPYPFGCLLCLHNPRHRSLSLPLEVMSLLDGVPTPLPLPTSAGAVAIETHR